MFTIDLDIGDVVLEDGGHVDLCIVGISSHIPVFFYLWWEKAFSNLRGQLESGTTAPCRTCDDGRAFHTSGKVPLEKTLEREVVSFYVAHDTFLHCAEE